MAKILLKEPDGPYSAEINTGAMDVEIRNAYIGVKFITEEGKTLSISMRDGDFELIYGKIANG